MTDKTVVAEFQPAVFPLAGVELNPPLRVKALKTVGSIVKGQNYFLRYVWPNGLCGLYVTTIQGAGNPYKMTDLVEMIRVPVGSNDNTQK